MKIKFSVEFYKKYTTLKEKITKIYWPVAGGSLVLGFFTAFIPSGLIIPASIDKGLADIEETMKAIKKKRKFNLFSTCHKKVIKNSKIENNEKNY